ncbi:hypothetical protein M8J75_012938 [Diaphorina citri]|nr:hypothetical protein M8J75_012938 [Diaphorina citri]
MAEIWDKNQKQWIKQLWLNVNKSNAGEGTDQNNGEKNDSLWSKVSEMVGFFHSDMAPNADGKRPESLPVGADCTLSPLPASTPSNHRVVCSPDLPVLCIAPAIAEESAVDSSTPPTEKLQCTVCNKTFTNKNMFQNHLKTHGKEGEDPYQFAHYGEKVYKCTICNETFTSKKNMENHIKSHSEPPSSKAEGDFSCGSTTSDKENKGEDPESSSPKPETPVLSPQPEEMEPLPSITSPNVDIVQHANRNLREICQYLYPMMPSTSHHARSPALLALATAAEAEDTRRQYYSPPLREDSPSDSHSSYGSPQSPLTSALPVTEPNVYLIPDSMASITRRNFTTPPPELSSGMSSPTNSASPVPDPDPDPMVLTVGREVLILPPRKRCKMILKSMEELSEVAAVRYSSVIQYAGGGLTE